MWCVCTTSQLKGRTALRNTPALKALTQALGCPLPVAGWSRRHDSCITSRWTHAPFTGLLPAMSAHVVAVHFGGDGLIECRHGRSALIGRAVRGAVTVLPEGLSGDWTTSARFDGAHVLLSPEHVRAISDAIAPDHPAQLMPCVASPDALLFQLAELIEHCVGLAEPATQLMLDQLLDAFCAQLVRGHSSALTSGSVESRRSRLDSRQLARLDAYLREHLGSTVTIDDLAALVGLSRFYFCTAFRHTTGLTPHDHLTALRMDRARELLAAHADWSIADVGVAVGYHTASAFCAAFKRITGSTPTQFRRRV